MKISKFFIILTTALFVMMTSTMSAFAVAAVAKSAVNVRSGPGVNYAKIDILLAGQSVNVTQCQGNWCYVEKDGPDGWVSGKYLTAPTGGGSSADDAAAKAFIEMFGSIVGGIIQSGTPPPATPKVCFYNGINYTGSKFCVNAGTNNNKLVGYWNNRISSLKVDSGASVTICRNYYYGGACLSYNNNMPVLPAIINNQTSSFQTF